MGKTYMLARAMTEKDIPQVIDLHNKFYSQLECPDFMNGYLNAFVIPNSTGEIVIAGGVQPLAEAVLVTNKDVNIVAIGKALVEALEICKYTCRKFYIDELHAFVSFDDYARHLERRGFIKRSPAYSLRIK
jgi:phosphoribosylformimino-5-aminoimidazole carboxamide ribonucleotide (ProFAR) isomerase